MWFIFVKCSGFRNECCLRNRNHCFKSKQHQGKQDSWCLPNSTTSRPIPLWKVNFCYFANKKDWCSISLKYPQQLNWPSNTPSLSNAPFACKLFNCFLVSMRFTVHVETRAVSTQMWCSRANCSGCIVTRLRCHCSRSREGVELTWKLDNSQLAMENLHCDHNEAMWSKGVC